MTEQNGSWEQNALAGKHILITGAAGFIGAHLALRLLRDSEAASVVGVDELNDYYDVRIKQYRLDWLTPFDRFSFVKGDIADSGQMRALFERYAPDIVVHLAAQVGVRHSADDPESYMRSNVTGFFNILEACRRSRENGARGVEHLVFASSSSVYGANQKIPYSTDDRADAPVSLYAATKKSGELLAHAYAKLYDIPCTGLRFFTVYGPAGRPDMAYFSFADKLRAGERITLFNRGACMRDFTYIDDVVQALMRVMAAAPARRRGEDGLPVPPYALYNVGNGQPVRLTELVEILQQALADAGVLSQCRPLEQICLPAPMQPGDVAVTFADTAPLERDFGFRPATPLREGLRRFAAWYAAYGAGGDR